MYSRHLMLPAADVNVADTQSYSACMNDENTARKQLQEIWHSFAAAERTRCTAEAKSGGIESYVDLLVCLQLASDADAAAKIQLRGARRK
jgi:hypothetical protein